VGELFFQFRPEGVSGVVLIAESHISIHTWPETGYAAADIYTCGELDPSPGIEIIGRSLGASRCRYATVRRGGAMDSGEARPQGRGVSIDAIADAVVFLGPRGY
jgi:S-adenosylmethionine/arginine decarboxylase-like enzyme